MLRLRNYQLDAVRKMHNGCVLCGDVGSGKSITAIAYYYIQQGGDFEFLKGGEYRFLYHLKDLYIITTARKRDTFEWLKELSPFLLSTEDTGPYENKVVIDSWNNISKYVGVKNAFFIFDEQRVVGKGPWVRSFLKLCSCNDWIMLSATPGDKWEDYIALFIANGFYRNKTDFVSQHIIFSRFTKYPQVEKYVNTRKLEYFRNQILVDMSFQRPTKAFHIDIECGYDGEKYKSVYRDRCDPDTGEPIMNASGLCYALRKVVNSDESREVAIMELIEEHDKVIIFYNFDYELEILKFMDWPPWFEFAEWNGHKHQPIPIDSDHWVYFVQYTAGCEGWNCIETDTIIFYSQHYSYKVMKQASGRIDRMNTPFINLYYYHLKSRSGIDLAIARALAKKKDFNERRFAQI